MQTRLQTRYSFTAQFLQGSAFFASQARSIEESNPETASLAEVMKHRAFVVSAVLQCAAALEAEIAEVVLYGPGHHLGSNGIDAAAHAKIKHLNEDRSKSDDKHEKTLLQYLKVLELLDRPTKSLKEGQKYEQAKLLIKLRNALIHYKSKWGPAMESDRDKRFKKLINGLKELKFEKPPFESVSTNFFPYHCLNASLASWSVTTAIDFIEEFYTKLGIQSPLKPYIPLDVPLFVKQSKR
ncbi:MAG: hypothetical protein ACU84H_10550 [Gammaproteobacteria bacterium]